MQDVDVAVVAAALEVDASLVESLKRRSADEGLGVRTAADSGDEK